jgi:hypothetical protein
MLDPYARSGSRQNEPALTDTGWVDAPMRGFMREAMASLQTR